jgi:hypothetical protein
VIYSPEHEALVRSIHERARRASDRIQALASKVEPGTPLARLDAFMAGFDHMGTGDSADVADSMEAWADLRETLAGAMRRPFGYAGMTYPLDACVWFREGTREWILEIAGEIGDTSLSCRHAQPASLAPEDVPGLPALHGLEAASRDALAPILDWYQPDDAAQRPLPEILADVASDLSEDRAEVLRLRDTVARLGGILDLISEKSENADISRLSAAGLSLVGKAGLHRDPQSPAGHAIRLAALGSLLSPEDVAALSVHDAAEASGVDSYFEP